MREKYPENIEELDKFYRDHLHDQEMPSSLSWEKLNSAYSPIRTQSGKISKRNLYLGMSLGINIILASALGILYFTTPEARSTNPAMESPQPALKSVPQESRMKEEPAPIDSKDFKTGAKKSNLKSINFKSRNAKEESEKVLPSLSETPSPDIHEYKEPEEIPVVTGKDKPDSTTFYDKYSKLKKDSVQKLFIPLK